MSVTARSRLSDIYEIEDNYRCNLTSPAQFVKSDQICNGVYDCMDRSDEANCTDLEGGMTETEVFVSSPKMSEFEECSNENGGLGVIVGSTCRG